MPWRGCVFPSREQWLSAKGERIIWYVVCCRDTNLRRDKSKLKCFSYVRIMKGHLHSERDFSEMVSYISISFHSLETKTFQDSVDGLIPEQISSDAPHVSFMGHDNYLSHEHIHLCVTEEVSMGVINRNIMLL